MMINKDIEQYILDHSMPEDPVLAELTRETYLKTTHPNMLSGPILGRLLEMISRMIRPTRILEIGTFTGYSAICLARGLNDDGRLLTIDINDELVDLSSGFFEKAGVSDKINQVIGNALDILSEIDEAFDLAFIDGDKREYLQYYELLVPLVRSEGWILADNVLWGGRVVSAGPGADPETSGIRNFNAYVRKDERVENLILPVRDGIQVIRKL